MKNSPIEKILYFNNSSTDSSQSFTLCTKVLKQHMLQFYYRAIMVAWYMPSSCVCHTPLLYQYG